MVLFKDQDFCVILGQFSTNAYHIFQEDKAYKNDVNGIPNAWITVEVSNLGRRGGGGGKNFF